jgi:hypothetical protein
VSLAQPIAAAVRLIAIGGVLRSCRALLKWRCAAPEQPIDAAMRIATYNVNGVNGRLPNLLARLEAARVHSSSRTMSSAVTRSFDVLR